MKRLKQIIMWRGYLYRLTMKIAHKYNWHYAPPIYPEGDTQLWCKWCGFRQTIKRSGYKAPLSVNDQAEKNG